MDIVLSTLNARYHHASFGLRYLRANLGQLRDRSQIIEFILGQNPEKIVLDILALKPKIVGFGVYIWNVEETLAVVSMLKRVSPETVVVIGGPEVSHETEIQPIVSKVDYVICGEADHAFREFCEKGLETGEWPTSKILKPDLPEISSIQFPYDEYTDADIENRTIYVEASRGCPYKCEYCLSSLDKSVRNFNCDRFLYEMQRLLDRGVRQFKFVDRTFNLSPTISTRILKFYLERISLGLFLHFEMVPDRLPDELKDLMKQFPKCALQFEIGVQTFNPITSQLISRRQDLTKLEANLHFLKHQTQVHTHVDLIIGLPGEDEISFAEGFNRLVSMGADEIQVGVLKRLNGAPVARHSKEFEMVYCEFPPYTILRNNLMSFETIQCLTRFADVWDRIANSGAYVALMIYVKHKTEMKPFNWFLKVSEAMFLKFGRTHSISKLRFDAELIQFVSIHDGLSIETATDLVTPKVERVHTPYVPGATPKRQQKHAGL